MSGEPIGVKGPLEPSRYSNATDCTPEPASDAVADNDSDPRTFAFVATPLSVTTGWVLSTRTLVASALGAELVAPSVATARRS